MLQTLNLKTTHKPVKAYYKSLEQFEKLGVSHETAVKSAFQSLLESCCSQFGWTLIPEFKIQRSKGNLIFVDGALVDQFHLTHGFWEAKDIHDDLEKELKKKFDAGYPRNNILFQTPERAILCQNNQQFLETDLTKPDLLIDVLKRFFEYRPPQLRKWENAVEEFKERVPKLANGLVELIKVERAANSLNKNFIAAFQDFMGKCKQAINPNLSEKAVEEMLIQHLLTERIFSKIFNNPDFIYKNAIASEIEKVIHALTSKAFNKHEFLKSLDPFYAELERTAATIQDFSQKQGFLNTVYEQFFQGFSVKVADTHGIVYTPQPIVDFMVKSVEDILQNDFDRSLSDENVHILDPFVGTGNFIVRIMQEIKKTALRHKYRNELHCNEVMLLPYYIASMNIEHEFFVRTKSYEPFDGICLVDTFELMEGWQKELFVEENMARVEKQTQAPMFVIIGNPPYNASQVNENDNNKNRVYKRKDGADVDSRVSETYATDSNATNKNALSDPYVKAIRWASDRIGDEGIVAFVTNNSFINAISFDGMRKNLMSDFSKIYHINLKGNARTSGERRRKEAGNIFDDKIRVGVGITFFVKKKDTESSKAEVWIYSIDDYLKSKAKKDFLIQSGSYTNIPMKKVSVDKKHNWLTEGLRDDFETFVPIGNKETKRKSPTISAIFKIYGNGAQTGRDAWAYNFDRTHLSENIQRMVETYNEQVLKWNHRPDKSMKVDDFVLYDDSKISWSSSLKRYIKNGRRAKFSEDRIRRSLYRPFTQSYLYFDQILTHRRSQFPYIFPTPETETENRVICVSGIGSNKPFQCLMTNVIPDFHLTGDSQCFPFYVYDEDGTNRRENITDWALEQFRNHYEDELIDKWAIFHYIYALLHHPDYRDRYAENLKRELPRIPFAKDFWDFVSAGERLAELHIFYEDQPKYPLQEIETSDLPLDLRVEKMRLSKDKTSILYNDFMTIADIPSEAFEYRLGNRSALEWLIDRYRVKLDKRSGIVNDPNRGDDQEYIVRLIGQVITVSLKTVAIVDSLPKFNVVFLCHKN